MNNVRAQRLLFVLQCLDAEGEGSTAGDVALAAHSLSREKLTRPDCKVSSEQEARFVEMACDALDDNSFAVRAGLQFRDSTALTAYISKYSQNLRDAIENSAKYFSIIDPAYSIGLRVSSNSASFELKRLDPSLGHHHRFVEFLLFAGLGRMREITQSSFFPLEIRFDHNVKSAASKIARQAGFPVLFGAESCEMILSRASLELPIPTYDPSLREHLKEYGNRLKNENPSRDPGLRAQIEGILGANLPGRIVPAEETAANLGMSRRTFARRLKDKDLSYRQIVDDLRCDLARTYLKDGFSIAEVSFYLDYGDQAAFSTAFKRWTGHSPSEYRTSARPS